MYKLISAESKNVDPDLAKHYLVFNTYVGQRSIREAHVKELSDKMIEGLFRYGNVAFATLGKETVQMDGQHVLNAIVKSGCTIMCVIEKYRCESENDLSILFRQFEVLRRSQRDMIRAKHYALNITMWPLWISEIMVSAAGMDAVYGSNWRSHRMCGGTGTPVGRINAKISSEKMITVDNKIELLGSHCDEAEFLYRLVSDPDSGAADRRQIKHIARAIVVFMIMKTKRIHQNDCGTFWNRVIFGENLVKTKAEYKLREFLKDSVRGGGKKKEYYKTVSNHEIAYRIALAWNAFRKNSPTNLGYRIGSPIPQLL